jgi:uncharacterized membrane protein YphA (DoxX/SURF4 family)
MRSPFAVVGAWLGRPTSGLRLEIVRILAPLAVLGFMSGRLAHADEWIGNGGFRVPHLQDDPAQPLWLPGLATSAAWAVAAIMVLAGLAVVVGLRTRAAALVFAMTLAFVALSDRLAAFTVSKISPVIMVAVAPGPAGARLGFDAWRRGRQGLAPPAPMGACGPLRFLQLFLVTFYCASGLAKAGADWLTTPNVLWSHLHDSYQTWFAFQLARITPPWVWTPLQGSVLAFEVFAPLWFAMRRTRTLALIFGLGMHLMIGLMFGPVVWFALLMMTLLAGCFAPDRVLSPLDRLASKLEAAASVTDR